MNNGAKKKASKGSNWPLSRIGVGFGAATLAGATGYMNVSAWVAQASIRAEQIVNGCISGSLEVVGGAGLAWAGYQFSKKRPLRAALAAAAAAGAIYFNTGASLNYYEGQDAAARNAIELSGEEAASGAALITRLEDEAAAIITQNGGTLPRPLPAIEAAYSHLDPATNPINMARKATEVSLREEYERLQDEIADLREARGADVVASDDAVRPVIPEGQRLAFIWAVEVFKGSAFFLLGTDKLGGASRRPANPASGGRPATPLPTPANEGRAEMSGAERERRRKFAIMRAKGAMRSPR